MSAEVSGNLGLDESQMEWLLEHAAMMEEELHPDLAPWLEEGKWGPMLRHPLVYQVPYFGPGYANRIYNSKTEALEEAIADEDWHSVVFLHERPYRLKAMIDYCTGRNDEWEITPLAMVPEHWNLAADVWIDSENIEQNITEWRALFNNGEGLWLGNREAFDELPRIEHKDGPLIQAWRGGSVGDWSWTTNRRVAEFFSARSGLPIRGHQIPEADVFGYLTNRHEYELLVRYTDFRSSLVYPNGEPEAES